MDMTKSLRKSATVHLSLCFGYLVISGLVLTYQIRAGEPENFSEKHLDFFNPEREELVQNYILVKSDGVYGTWTIIMVRTHWPKTSFMGPSHGTTFTEIRTFKGDIKELVRKIEKTKEKPTVFIDSEVLRTWNKE